MKQIELLHDIPCKHQHLVYESAKFQHNTTLLDFDVQDGDVIDLVDGGRTTSMIVYLKTMTEETIPVPVEPFYTGRDLMLYIHAGEGALKSNQRLIHGSRLLHDDYSNEMQEIKDRAVLFLSISLQGS